MVQAFDYRYRFPVVRNYFNYRYSGVKGNPYSGKSRQAKVVTAKHSQGRQGRQGHFLIGFSAKQRVGVELQCDVCTCHVQFGSE